MWFIEFGRGAALPLTPEEAPGGDGEPMVPCAQGRIIVETARPAPPHFATCSSYRRRPILLGANSVASFGYQEYNKKTNRGGPRSPAARPEDLGVTPWFSDAEGPLETPPLDAHHSSNPLNWFHVTGDLRGDFSSTRNSSVEGERPPSRNLGAQRKAYMDLRDAIALLDETCPNPEASEPSPRTPRTPVNQHPKSKRARSKSSDNSSNYSNERLSEKSGDIGGGGIVKNPEREKKRPFLRKIGISKTEDRPFLSKLAPRIIGKPYLEKIGPSKAVEKPYLEKIGSSKTIDKFTFNVVGATGGKNFENVEDEIEVISAPIPRLVPREARISFRKRSGKGHQLQKMYSFETEDLTSFKDSISPVKSPRDPLRGASLDDVLDSGPSSLPQLEIVDEPEELPNIKSSSVAELLKCRIMSSDEIISSSSCLCSPQEAISWGNSPKRKNGSFQNIVKNSPVKRQISSSDSTEPKSKELAVICKAGDNSPTKLKRSVIKQSGSSTLPKFEKDEGIYSQRRQSSEDVLDRMVKESEFIVVDGKNRMDMMINERMNDNESKSVFDKRRGISSDNLKLSRELFIKYSKSEATNDLIVNDKWNLKDRKEFSKEAFKQLHRKFEPINIASSEEINERRTTFSRDDDDNDDDRENDLETRTISCFKKTREIEKESKPSTTRSGVTVRSVLRKQKSVESHDGIDGGRSLRKPKRRIFHEPSQETMDLLTELRKVKSLLKTPSIDKLDDLGPVKLPKKILLTDIEFCLSIDRENSVRRKPQKEEEEEEEKTNKASVKKIEEIIDIPAMPGPALIFEKRGLSLDYADDDKPSKPETRAISLVSARSPPSDTEETNSLIYDSKSYGSDVFNSPSSEEMIEGSNFTSRENQNLETRKFDDFKRRDDRPDDGGNHCNDVDIAIPIDQKNSPRRRVQIQARTSDLYEIISPRSTPFRVKKGLSKISVEDTMKQESFTLGKVDCRSVVVQKRNRCFPL